MEMVLEGPGGAAGDFARLFRGAAVVMKEKKKTGKAPAAPGESGITVPESTIEHVSTEAPSDIEERIQKALRA